MLSEAESWRASALVEDNVHGLEEDVTEDGEANTRVRLDTAEAGRASVVGWGVVDVAAWNGEGGASDGDNKVRERGGAREDVATVRLAVGGSVDVRVVRGDGGVWEVHEGGAGVGNGGANAAAGGVARSSAVSVGGELPEAVGLVDVGVGNAAFVCGGVNEAKVVASSLASLQLGGEQRRGKGVLDSVEESGLLVWLDSVDGAESEAKETIVVSVLLELRRDGSGSLNSLGGGSDGANNDCVGVDSTSSTGSITVGDVPGLAAQLLGVRWVVDAVARLLARGQQGGEDPTTEYVSLL